MRSFGTNEIPDVKTSKDVTYPKKGKVQGNCGKRENSKPFGRRGPWALRILGKLSFSTFRQKCQKWGPKNEKNIGHDKMFSN